MSLNKNPRYDLKRSYKKILNSSLIFSLFVIIAAFKYAPHSVIEDVYIEPPQNTFDVEDIERTIQDKHIPPPPKPLTIIEAPLDLDIPDIEIDDTDLNPDAGISKDPQPYVENDPLPENVFFIAVEENPSPIGGLAAITAKINYPAIALRANIHGDVFVNAFIDESGNVVKVELIKGIGGGCDEAAMDAVLKTKFNPGKQRGKPVKVKISVPVKFIIN